MALDDKGNIVPPVKITLGNDGWYYTNTGYRFHATKYPPPNDHLFDEVSDLEKISNFPPNN